MSENSEEESVMSEITELVEEPEKYTWATGKFRIANTMIFLTYSQCDILTQD
jgi:hypothetical protein